MMDDQAIEREVKWLDRQYAARVAYVLDPPHPEHDQMWRTLAARCCRRLNEDKASRTIARSARKKVLRKHRMQVSGHAHYATDYAISCLRTYLGEERRVETGEIMLDRALWRTASLAPCMALLKGDADLPYGDPRLSCRLIPEEEAQTRP
jgi:hypothetical protein